MYIIYGVMTFSIMIFCDSSQRLPLTYDEKQGLWIMNKELPVSASPSLSLSLFVNYTFDRNW